MARIQANRIASLSTPLGEDVLLLRSLHLTEKLGRMFQAELELSSEDHAVDFSQIVGQNVTITINRADGAQRYINGYVSRFVQVTHTSLLARYRATVVPKLWLLTRKTNCRIFQAMSIPDIIKQVLSDSGYTDIKDSLSGTYTPWDYCVQYRETDFNFISRLMEQEGIYYFFDHEDGKHTLVLADSVGAHTPAPMYEKLEFRPDGAEAAGEYVYEWSVEQLLQPGKVTINDFDFKSPKKKLKESEQIVRPNVEAEHEVYDYPGEYDENGDGKTYAKVRIEELQSQFEIVSGSTDAMGLMTGYTFDLAEFPREDQNRSYLITSANYQLTSDEADAGGGSEGSTFTMRFTAMNASEPFRPARVTPKPIVQGAQTAVVAGPPGEEIYVDQYGRVKLQFHWDRDSKGDDNSSCWVRVSQVWAGKQWGVMHIPRIGQEVIVDFLEGDPDQPIITGRVYNGDNMPPYALPANKTQSGIKSRSSKGGSPANFNEIRMEDLKGSEQLYIHAEKNEDIVVENNKTESVGNNETINIGNDRTETVGHNETILVENDRVETVLSNETLTVEKNRTRLVNQNETVTVALMRTHTVGVNEAITIGAAQEITVGAIQATTVGASQSNTVGANQSESVKGNRTVDIGKDDSLKVGKRLRIEAGDEIMIKTGEASIHMKKDGTITIKGKNIKIEGSGAISIKASKDLGLKGQKILQN